MDLKPSIPLSARGARLRVLVLLPFAVPGRAVHEPGGRAEGVGRRVGVGVQAQPRQPAAQLRRLAAAIALLPCAPFQNLAIRFRFGIQAQPCKSAAQLRRLAAAVALLPRMLSRGFSIKPTIYQG